MRFHYVSPSTLPSRSANSVHVMLQCEALANEGVDVTLYAKRSIPSSEALANAVCEAYGVLPGNLTLKTHYSRFRRAESLMIALDAVRHLRSCPSRDAVLSRNLYAAYILAVAWRRPLIFETHQLEYGVRKGMQQAIISRPWVRTVAISQALVEHLTQHHGVAPVHPLVLHDAARAGIEPLGGEERRQVREELGIASGAWNAVCGYFGHLYAGRGIEIIQAVAAQRPRCLFVVYGGNEKDVAAMRAANKCANLQFRGHVPYPVAQSAMRAVDVLMMPYQAQVSIGVARHDTARWMSPMKMFEYMATGVPIIASDLPVLREVLTHERNALMVQPDAVEAWVAALDRLVELPALGQAIGDAAHRDYAQHYTWRQRARHLLAAMEQL